MKSRKLFKRWSLGALFLGLFVTIAHAIIFPQETRCILVDFYDFERDGDLYYRNDVDKGTINELKEIINQAKINVATFWKEKTVEPKFIYCEDDSDYKKFGVPYMTPACANMKLGAYVVISRNGINEDVISHEISHTELFNRIGFFNRLRKIPTWFDEGLAMQVDLRDYYSTDTLAAKTNDLVNLPDVTRLNAPNQFFIGTKKEVMLNYMTARYTVGEWYTDKKLEYFIKKINQGDSFEKAYYDVE